MVSILGIVNITRDSFSDGGRYLSTDAAVAHARRLIADGATAVDLGAESTHPDSEDVSPEEQIDRLTPVVETLHAEGIAVSIDAYHPAVIRHALTLGVAYINDITALRDPVSVAAVVERSASQETTPPETSPAKLILMHSRASRARAERDTQRQTPVHAPASAESIVDEILRFFERRIGELERAGVNRDRLILDPGMGFFLSPDPHVSLAVLRGLPRLAALGPPLLVSTSRKSFIGALLADSDAGQSPLRPPADRGSGTLATELWAATHGAAYIRTHDVRALADALRMWSAITPTARA